MKGVTSAHPSLERLFGKPAGPIPEKPALVNKMYLMAYFYQSEHRLE
jgi:hypothetical protein